MILWLMITTFFTNNLLPYDVLHLDTPCGTSDPTWIGFLLSSLQVPRQKHLHDELEYVSEPADGPFFMYHKGFSNDYLSSCTL